MKNLCLAACSLLWLVSQAPAVLVGPFPGLDKMIGQSDLVMIVRIESREAGIERDHWGRYQSRVMFVLKGSVPERGISSLRLCGAITDWPHSFSSDTVYLVFLNKDSTVGGEYRAPATIGAVLRVSPFTREAELRGTLREKIEQVVREGRDFCMKIHDNEQRTFRAMLGEPQALSVPLPAAPVPKR